MMATRLERGAPAWRAARAAACFGALLRAQGNADTALEQLADVGRPQGGWLEVFAALRAPQITGLALVLPRPGDARGVAMPRDVLCEAAVGWGDAASSTWLIPTDDHRWDCLSLPTGVAPPEASAADRQLRSAVVAAAHLLDHGAIAGPPRLDRPGDGDIDAWLIAEPLLPARRRDLAARGLRILQAVGAARSSGLLERDRVVPLDEAARGAVEAAYGTLRRED